MAEYVIRVELRGNPPWEQYEKLHALMATVGFLQTVDGVNKKGEQKTFDLPHAVYYGTSDATTSDVRDWVQSNVKGKIQDSILFLVVKSETWALGW